MELKKLKFELLKKIQRKKKGVISKAGKDCKPPKGENGNISADLLLKGLSPCEPNVNTNKTENKLRM